MKLTLLGTGHALVTKYYNTCFLLQENGAALLVDGGGGNGILKQLEQVRVDIQDIRQIFVTHKHIDHILGIVWLMRMICHRMNKGKYIGEAAIYGHEEVIALLRKMATSLLQPAEYRFLDQRLHLEEVKDGEEKILLGHKTTFFDIHSTKAKQFGFTMEYKPGKKFTCCGDEPYNEANYDYVVASTWLTHEAFCLYGERASYQPYEKHHSTVKDACELASKLHVKNLLLYHTEDDHYEQRKALYLEEGKKYFQGNLLVPEDLASFNIE